MDNFVVQYDEVRHNKVRLPKEFTSMFADSLENPLEMITSNGIVWNVEFATFHDEVWLTAGWSKVADWFNFSRKDFAVFRYNGRSSFKVGFFDNNGLKKLPADVPPTTKRGKSVVIIHRDDYNERLRLPLQFCEQIQFGLSNPVLVMTGDGNAFQVNWKMRSRTICLTYGWRKVAQQLGLTMDDFVFVKLQTSSRLCMKVVRILPDNVVETRLHFRHGMTIGSTHRSTELEEGHSCEQTDHARNMRLFSGIDYVVVVYHTTNAKYIKLPAGFVQKWRSSLASSVLVRTGDEKVRVVHIQKYQEEIWLLDGWTSIANDFNLDCGDVLLFEYYGKACFNLLCFNSNYHEKRPDPNWVPLNIVNMFTTFTLDCYKDRLMLPSWFSKNFRRSLQNPVKVKLDDGSEWVVNWITIEQNIWLDAGWKDVSKHCDFKYEDFLFMVVTNSSEINIRVVRRAAKRLANAKGYIRSVLKSKPDCRRSSAKPSQRRVRDAKSVTWKKRVSNREDS